MIMTSHRMHSIRSANERHIGCTVHSPGTVILAQFFRGINHPHRHRCQTFGAAQTWECRRMTHQVAWPCWAASITRLGFDIPHGQACRGCARSVMVTRKSCNKLCWCWNPSVGILAVGRRCSSGAGRVGPLFDRPKHQPKSHECAELRSSDVWANFRPRGFLTDIFCRLCMYVCMHVCMYVCM
jgi:hypothetical protein